MSSSEYLVGIDLGTTHTVVAYAKRNAAEPAIHLLPILQLIAPGEVAERNLLPSVRYHPADGELNAADVVFSAQDGAVLGEAARYLGAKSLGRLVTSAKSWLSHPDIDATAAILPWGTAAEVSKVSPLVASSSYLQHVITVWNQRFPEAKLEQQELVITVPASFDESARSLTLQAAYLAGIKQVRLLEEPQAVCYDWLRRHQQDLNAQLAGKKLILVCDVGGGTSDFTLIKIDHSQAEPNLERIAVGDHLLLGGDNIDLSLAHLLESRLQTEAKKLSTTEFVQLVEQCRIAKENLLRNDAPDQVTVTLLGGGSRLIGGSRSAVLSREEVLQIALDGFLPLSAIEQLPNKKRSGMVEFGLAYASDPAISHHLAGFLQQHRQATRQLMQDDLGVPDTLLLNGGVFRSELIQSRLQSLLSAWRGQLPVSVLDNPHPELAVAYGAVAYAQALHSQRPRISGGAPRSYFLRVEKPGSVEKHGICLLPKGSAEGLEVILDQRQFALRVGSPVQFHLLSHSSDHNFQSGQILELNDEQFHSLPPLVLALEGEQKQEVMVRLSANYTELGTLQMSCLAINDANLRWDLEFQVRGQKAVQLDAALPSELPRALEAIQSVFGAKSKQVDANAVKTLRADLEKVLGAARPEWESPLLRALFAGLLEGAKYRRRSEAHERLWLNLAGYCLRPGFGYPLDEWRVERLWALYAEGLQFVNDKQNWAEWWTLWRRVAGGLNVQAQQRIFADIAKFINPASARQAGVAKQLLSRSYEDVVRLAAVLEQLPLQEKAQLGEWLLKRLQKSGEPEQTAWALGRVGARILFHGQAQNVLGAEQVAVWLNELLAMDWRKQPQLAFAATMLARRCNDRGRDLDDVLRAKVIEKLKQSKAPASWLQMVAEFQVLDAQQERQIFGEALPPGLKIVD